MKFKLINKFTDFIGREILKIGDIIEPNEKGIYVINYTSDDYKQNIEFSIDTIRETKQNGVRLFEEVEELELTIEEVSDNDENLITNWRIQLDIKTTRKKLKEFEKIFKESIDRII